MCCGNRATLLIVLNLAGTCPDLYNSDVVGQPRANTLPPSTNLMNCFRGLFCPCIARHSTLPEQIRLSSPPVPTLRKPDKSADEPASSLKEPQSSLKEPQSSLKKPQSSFKEVRDTTLEVLRFSLPLLSTVSDAIPVPGLKAAFSGLEMVLGWFDVSSLCSCH
jgi:hypothetical protein